MTFTDAENAKLYRLNTLIEKNIATNREMCVALTLQVKKRAFFKLMRK